MYRCTIDGHCCLASVPRGFAVISELIGIRNADSGLSVNSFPAGEMRSTVLTGDRKEVRFQLRVDLTFSQEGRATLTLNPDRRATFTVEVHVPAWCQNFKAFVNGKTFIGTPGQQLTLPPTWNRGTVIQVAFDLHPQLLGGGKSYPGFVALKNGPQVLALEQALNPQINNFATVSLTSALLTDVPKTQLPKGWLGSKIYSVQGMADGKPTTLTVVPFAEVGQKGVDLAVWIRKTGQ